MQSTSSLAGHTAKADALAPLTGLLWTLSAALGVAAAVMLCDGTPGLSWPILAVGAALALLLIERPTVRLLCSRRYAAVGLACLVSGAAAVTAEPGIQVLVFLGLLWCGAVATCLSAGLPPRSLGAGRLAGAPFVAPALIAREGARVVGEGVSALGTERSLPPLRGVVLAVPIAAVLIALLGEADPAFAAFRAGAVALLTNVSGLGRVVFGVAVAFGCLGALNLARRDARQPIAWRKPGVPTSRHTDVERVIVLGSIAALFAVFLLLQVSYLFGNPGARPGSGMTLAEAVHRGFTEMSIVVAFVAGILAALDRQALRGARERWVEVLGAVVVIECLVLLASAYHRLTAYEAAYGYTELRIAVRLYIGFLAVTIVLLAAELSHGIDVARFCWRISVVALVALVVLGYWNHSAWIVEANVERFARSGQLDREHLARTGTDGLPALVAALPRLDAETRVMVVKRVCGDPDTRCRSATTGPGSSWFEWNLRRASARAALEELSHDVP